MPPVPPPETEPEVSHAGAAWLNGLTWLVVVIGWLGALVTSNFYLVFLAMLAATLGATGNVIMCLALYATGQSQRAQPYLIGAIPLVLLSWWMWSEFQHLGKIGG